MPARGVGQANRAFRAEESVSSKPASVLLVGFREAQAAAICRLFRRANAIFAGARRAKSTLSPTHARGHNQLDCDIWRCKNTTTGPLAGITGCLARRAGRTEGGDETVRRCDGAGYIGYKSAYFSVWLAALALNLAWIVHLSWWGVLATLVYHVVIGP
jgi:hypothetical protein